MHPHVPSHVTSYSPYLPNAQQMLPSFTPPLLPSPHIPQQYHNANPPRPTLLPAQPIPNPNNRAPQPIKNIEVPHSQTFSINVIPIHDIQLRAGRTFKKTTPIVIIREDFEEQN